MIAMITTAKSLSHAVKYNEEKVSNGKARNLLQNLRNNADPPLQTVGEKIDFLQKRADLNKRVKVQALHITLNFDPKEDMGAGNVNHLTAIYMERIGFGKQPYLMYEHVDAAHPHFHIVTTPIDENGVRIPVNDIIRFGSLNITRQMEAEFDLLRTHGNKQPGRYDVGEPDLRHNLLEEAMAPPIEYGKETMGPAMDRTLKRVLGTYRFTSLEEFNALLRPYRLRADRGLPGSSTYIHRGLVYKVLDEEGKQVGNYIKASALPGKPMLAYLEKRFEAALPEQAEQARTMRNMVDWALLGENFAGELQEQGVDLIWANDHSRVVFVNHRSRWAISEQVMGELYGAAALKAYLGFDQQVKMDTLWQKNRHTEGFSLSQE